MLHLNIARLPLHEQRLYKLILFTMAIAFIHGVLWVLFGLGDKPAAADNDWQKTSIAVSEDPLAQFGVLAETPRWFAEVGSKGVGVLPKDPLKALEGKPESFRLTGLVTKGDKTYALFLPTIIPAGATEKPAVRQLAEGDMLVGEWVIKHISHNQVEIQQGSEIQTLKMYQSKPK